MMKNKCFKSRISFSLVLICTLMSSLRVAAAGTDLQKELTITAASEADYKEQAEEAFALKLNEDGRVYERTEIRYEVISKEYVNKKEKEVVLKEEPQKAYKEDGVTYTLEKSDREEQIVQEAAEQTVTAYDDYDTYVTAADVPATKTVTATNEVTGEQESVTCGFTGITSAGTRTVENVMTITFSNYDAAYYEWNGNYIARNDQTPPLAGYESQLLAQAGATSGSEITGYYYTGNPYTVDGVVYRDAAATVRQEVQIYRANYVGSIAMPEEKETVYTAIYSTPDTEGKVELTVKAVADYVEKQSILTYIFAGVGVLIFVGLIIVILIVLSKKQKEKSVKEK